jgi:hypothetical protein
MSRIVSVWLRGWPIARLAIAQAPVCGTPAEAFEARRPLVLVASGQGGARITALNRAAAQSGLAVGELVTSARS